jgi:hypothetical protein
MTASAHLQLTDRVLAALQADPPLVDGPVVRGRAVVLAKGFTGAIGIRLARAGGQAVVSGCTQWQTAMVIECLKRAADGEDASTAVDQLLQDVFARIAAPAVLFPAKFTGEPEIAWDYDEQDPSVGAASLILRADHITTRSTLQPIT